MTSPALRISGTLFAGRTQLIAGFDLTLPAGRWSVLLGASGVGKTSLLRLLAGLPCAAHLTGRITSDASLPLTSRVAMMAQDDQLLPWASALDNVTICARLRGVRPKPARAAELLVQVGLAGLEGRKPAQMSAGQRQRVALARTLYEDRDIVLLDEPFSALDALTRQSVQELAVGLLAGRTVVLITHDPAEAIRLADAAWMISPLGITQCTLPRSAIPRAAADPETLAAQAALLDQMRTCAAGCAA
jgi:putative hydroxymethylpyrimidine transport system ATP-binding protein